MATAALTRRPRKARDARHLMRYLKSKAGMSVVDIAKEEHVQVKYIRESIREIEAHESLNSEGQMQLAVRDLVISVIPQAKDTINGLLLATETVETTDYKTGTKKNVQVEDKTTRLEAARLVKDLLIGMQPKGPGNVIQVNQQVQQTTHIGSAETTEERLRRLRKQAEEHNLLPAEVAGVPAYIDAELVEPEIATDEDAEEDEESGE